jgi:hypothetical protein
MRRSIYMARKGGLAMKMTRTNILKSGIWLTLPPLLFSLGLMYILPTALTATQFNAGIPTTFLIAENALRLLIFTTPLLFTVGTTSRTQKNGFVLYLVGVGLYFLSYGTQNFFPQSAWSTSFFGFVGSAFLNIFWLIGLGMMGDEFYLFAKIKYQPSYFIVLAILFVSLHSIHSIIYYQGNLK